MPEDNSPLKKIDTKLDGLNKSLGNKLHDIYAKLERIQQKQHDVDVWVDKFTGRYTPLWLLGCFLLGLLVAEVFNRL